MSKVYRDKKLVALGLTNWNEYRKYKRDNAKCKDIKKYQRDWRMKKRAEKAGFENVDEFEKYLQEKKENSRTYIIKRRKDEIEKWREENKDKIKYHPTFTNYGCDEDGNVYNLRLGRMLKVDFNDVTGYCQTHCPKKYSLHKFVWECFNGLVSLGKDSDSITINHIDTDKTNNKISNLELLSKKDNVMYSKTNDLPYGVSYVSYTNNTRYHVQIVRNMKRYLGSFVGEKTTFDNIEDAIRVRDMILKKLGE